MHPPPHPPLPSTCLEMLLFYTRSPCVFRPGPSTNAPTHTWVGSTLGTSQRSLLEVGPTSYPAGQGFVAADRDGSISGVREACVCASGR